jgi:hypothetical protein
MRTSTILSLTTKVHCFDPYFPIDALFPLVCCNRFADQKTFEFAHVNYRDMSNAVNILHRFQHIPELVHFHGFHIPRHKLFHLLAGEFIIVDIIDYVLGHVYMLPKARFISIRGFIPQNSDKLLEE